MMKPFGKPGRAAMGIAAMIGSISVSSLSVHQAKADPTRDFVVSCSYGVLAGTLVGAATLAFSDRPGDNLNRVARGASLGLYAGILLGAYVVYGVPAEDEDAATQLRSVSRDPVKPSSKAREISPLLIYPLIGDRGLEGAAGSLRLVSF